VKTADRKRARASEPARFIVVTGLSGAGKSQAIRALEDLGYYCVDNLPVALLPFMADFARQPGTEPPRIAVVVDIREPRFTSDFPRVFKELRRARDLAPVLIFLEASHAELVRRFSETRRPHPLAPDRPVTDGLAEERGSLRPIRAMADQVIDTSSMNVHELRQAFLQFVSGKRQASKLVLTFLSFGFPYGVPAEADLMFDVRFLKNPHWVPTLRPQTGRDRAVQNYMRRQPATAEFQKKLTTFLRFLVPQYVEEGKAYLTVAIGCTGGRHRSVFMAEYLKREFAGMTGVTSRVRHRELERQK
jgi:RNase adapter protein RapZ